MSPTSDLPEELRVVESPDAFRLGLMSARQNGERIGVVPTMGALHAGHLSLVEAAKAECDVVVVTIFVNPLQFGPGEDFEQYPRPMDSDLQKCRDAGVQWVFHPTPTELYPPGFETCVDVNGLSQPWEGKSRPTHFRGVTTVVLKLLNIVQADIAFFGEKDFQQLAIIKRMCRDLHVPTEIRGCSTVRDSDGLALSSRNQYLSPDERESALALSQCLQLAEDRITQGETNLRGVVSAMQETLESKPNVIVDYVTIADPDSLEELTEPKDNMVALVAAKVGQTRLIDNRLMTIAGGGV